MTSDTRALTALHTLNPTESVFGVRFEPLAGLLWPDTSIHTQYNVGNEYWGDSLRCDDTELSPYLSNRLFALGLHQWASDSSVHEKLRDEWRFEIELIVSTDPHHVPGSLWGQGFAPLLPTSPAKDIALLKARRLDPPDWKGIRPFPITSPAVFFDQIEVANPDYGFLQNPSDVYAAYTSPFLPMYPLLPTACLDGEYSGANVALKGSLCQGEDRPPETREFHSLHRTTLDSSRGTSGGAILGENLLRVGDGGTASYRWLQAFGVLHGASHPAGSDPQGWYQVDPAKEAEYGTQFTAIGDDWKFSNRDGENPSLPSPIYGEKDEPRGCSRQEVQSVVVNGQTYTNTVCVEWNESTEQGDEINGVPIDKELEPIENPDPNSPHHGKYIKFLCGASYPSVVKDGVRIESDPGVGVGILGSLHLGVKDGQPIGESNLFANRQNLIDSGAGVGSFFLICGPYSSVPFTSNWRFLKIGGNTIQPRWDSLGGSIAFSELRRALVVKNEVRGAVRDGKQEVYVRPPSFKTCPPGYLLSGLKFSKSRSHLLALEELKCVLPDGTEVVRVKTESGRNSDMQLFGRRFSLTQKIGFPLEGMPDCSAGTGDPLLCPETVEANCRPSHPLMRGFNIYHDAVGRLTNVVPICVEKVIP